MTTTDVVTYEGIPLEDLLSPLENMAQLYFTYRIAGCPNTEAVKLAGCTIGSAEVYVCENRPLFDFLMEHKEKFSEALTLAWAASVNVKSKIIISHVLDKGATKWDDLFEDERKDVKWAVTLIAKMGMKKQEVEALANSYEKMIHSMSKKE